MQAKALIWLTLVASNAAAQAARPVDQFYTNGESVNAWSVDAKKKLRSTLWFGRNPPDSPVYQELTAIIYDAEPDKVLYIDKASKRIVGRMDLSAQKFSLLPPDAQKARQALEAIKFPPAGALPTVAQMFEPLPDGQRGNTKKLMPPPPTLQFPQLEQSTWETSYMSADRFLIRSELQLDGDHGVYRLSQKPGTGRLSDIKYEREGDEHVIRGNWNLGRSNGHFKFNVPAENLNVFWGEFGFQEGRTVGAWDGVRKSRPALKETKNSLR